MATWTRLLVALGLAAAIAACGGPAGLTDPDSPEGLLGNAQKAMLSGQTDQALQLATRAIELQPRSARAYTMLGMIHRLAQAKQADPAQREAEIQAFLQAVELAPQSVSARANLVASLLRQGDGRAQEQLARLREIAGDAPWTSSLQSPPGGENAADSRTGQPPPADDDGAAGTRGDAPQEQ